MVTDDAASVVSSCRSGGGILRPKIRIPWMIRPVDLPHMDLRVDDLDRWLRRQHHPLPVRCDSCGTNYAPPHLMVPPLGTNRNMIVHLALMGRGRENSQLAARSRGQFRLGGPVRRSSYDVVQSD